MSDKHKPLAGLDGNLIKSRLAIVIPALNEEKSIWGVVQKAIQSGTAIVVDDGSNDRTAELARDAGAHVVSHSINMGYDAALETGLRTAVEVGCEFAVTMDADGQHDPRLVQRFYHEFENRADIVIGVRDRTQRWSEKLFSIVGRAVWGIHDPLCGMKGYRLHIIRTENLIINSYKSVGTELAIRLVKKGFLLHQIKVKTRDRKDASRFGGAIKANLYIIAALFKGLLL